MSVPQLDELALASINEQQAECNDAWSIALDARMKKRNRDVRAIMDEIKLMKHALNGKEGELSRAKKELKALDTAKTVLSTST